jgi:hypothetical protein
MHKHPLLSLEDIDDFPAPQLHSSAETGKVLRGAELIAQCTPDLTEIDMTEIATERRGSTSEAIERTIIELLDGLAMRVGGDATASAAIMAIRDWHLPDLRGLVSE